MEARICITSTMPNLTVIGDFVTEAAERLALDDDQTFALQVAIDEACANIIEYAYSGRTDGNIEIVLSKSATEEAIVTIRDFGRRFDPDAIARPDVTAPLEKRQEGGLGLYLMEKLMDSVSFCFDPVHGNILTMRKGKSVEKQPRSTAI